MKTNKTLHNGQQKVWMRITAAFTAAVLLAGCAGTTQTESETSETTVSEAEVFRIGITQIVDHKALNDAREGFESKLQELGVSAEFDEKNAQGDVSNALMIADGFVQSEVDLILAIATPTTQTAQKATEATDIPVVFTAVSDPVAAGIVESLDKPGGNISGVTDAVTEENLQKLLELFKSIKPDADTIGVIFNTAEVNSAVQVEMLKTVSERVGLSVKEVGIADIASIDPAMEMVAAEADALMLINDNMIASSIGLIAEKAKERELITLSTDSSHVEGGAFLSLGISYRQIGEQAAVMAKKILVDKISPSEIAVENSNTLFKFVNRATAEALQLDISVEALSDAELVG